MVNKSITKKNKKLCLATICMGLILLGVAALAGYEGWDDRFLGFGSGLGSAAIAFGCIGLITLRRNPEDTRRLEIDAKDERSIQIRGKAANATFHVTLIGLSVVEFVFVALNDLTACFIIIGLMAVHVVSYFIFLYRYSEIL